MKMLKLVSLLSIIGMFSISSWAKTKLIYEIETARDLAEIGKSLPLDGNYKLINDIDLKEEGFENWEPIYKFTGKLNGLSHTISNLKVEKTGNSVGLFGNIQAPAEISNLTLINVDVTGAGENSTFVGGLIGLQCCQTSIENCHVIGGTVKGKSRIGGLVGHQDQKRDTLNSNEPAGLQCYATIIKNCSTVYVNVSGSYEEGDYGYSGGLVGSQQHNTMIVNSFATGGKVSGHKMIGGLVGKSVGASN